MTINQIIQGDCLEVMRSMPDNSVDLIITDPPYFKVKSDWWDRQWSDADKFLAWIDQLAEQWARLLKPNGSLYCFASPKMSARVEVTIGRRFNVLNNIRWDKKDHPGRHKGAFKEGLRCYFGASESIIFAEHFGADNSAKGEAGYEQECDKLRGFVFEPLRAYLDGERQRSKTPHRKVIAHLGMSGHDSHFFSPVQWKLPLEDQYLAMRELFGSGYLARPYESLRQQYEELRRPFNVTAQVPYTDTWTYPTVQSYKGKHVCEKPAAMLEDMINASSKPGTIVLDSFAGSGSTLIAAQKLGRQFIGIEIDPHWVNVATDKLYPQSVAA
jgi:site-specific DNA-methyltransferase (adenine-specific)